MNKVTTCRQSAEPVEPICDIIPTDRLSEICRASMGGDAAATTLVQAIIRIVAAAHSEDTSQRPICLTCDQAFEHSTPPACFVVFRPERDDPSWVIVNALCARCLGKPASELKRAIMEIWHQTAQPSLRAINLHHTPGHA